MMSAGLSPLASMSAMWCTGMRVPLTMGVPLSTSGVLDTIPRALLNWLSPERTARAAGRASMRTKSVRNHRLSRLTNRRRHHGAPAPKCEHVRGLVGQLEANKRLWCQKPGLIASLHGSPQEARIDDPVHLTQRHTGNGCCLIRGHEHRLICGHLNLQNLSSGLETYNPQALILPACSAIGLDNEIVRPPAPQVALALRIPIRGRRADVSIAGCAVEARLLP